MRIEKITDYMAHRHYAQAQAEIKRLLGHFPQEPELYHLYARCEQCMDADVPLSRKELESEMYERAQEKAAAGEYGKAIDELRLIKDAADNKEDKPFLGIVYNLRVLVRKEAAALALLMGDKDKAKTYYEDALRTALNTYPQYAFERVAILLQMKDYKGAKEAIAHSRTKPYAGGKSDSSFAAYHNYKALGDRDKAGSALDEALSSLEMELQTNRFDPQVYAKQARRLVCKAELSNDDAFLRPALVSMKRALALRPDFEDYRLWCAEIHARLSGAEEEADVRSEHREAALGALDLLKRGNYLAKYCPYRLAAVYGRLREYDKAQALRLQPALCARGHYEALRGYYKQNRQGELLEETIRRQRQEPHFLDRVCESELSELLEEKN